MFVPRNDTITSHKQLLCQMQDTDLKERLQNFPKDGYEQIEGILASSAPDGKSPVNARTIRKIIFGLRTDNHGVIDAFITMTDAVKEAMESATQDLKAQLNS